MTAVQGDTKAAVDFLKKWREAGPWLLIAIDPEDNSIQGETFRKLTEQAMFQWIEKWNGSHNLYFTVNPIKHDLRKKAKKTDMRGMDWLHVDVDPRVGEDIKLEQERALSLLRGFNPPPTVITFSGGGYQGFWKLDEELITDGDEARAAEFEPYNLQLELLLTGDSCHNIDRIMRLPGTVNVPNKRKRDKGRVPALSKVVEWHDDRLYPISKFAKAPRLQTKESGMAARAEGTRVKISGNLARVEPEQLDAMVTAGQMTMRTKMLIVQGDDPDDPTKYGSRSDVLWAVLCELVRGGVDDDTIAAIITDPDWAVSAHVLDQPRSKDYAARQINRAREFAINPILQELNDKFIVIGNYGGKCVVLEEHYDELMKRDQISDQSFEAFQNRFMHRKIEIGEDKDGKPLTMPIGKWWLQNANRRQADRLKFAPNREIPNVYNMWRGFQFNAVPGDCSLYLAHIRDNICGGDEIMYDYVINWLARCVQFPGEAGEVAIVMRGGMGTGKSFFAKHFGKLWGRHFLQISDSKHLVGSFNAHLRDCVTLFADEAFFAGDKRHSSTLKTLVTEEYQMIEGKGKDAEPAPNYVHLLMASNHDWLVPAGPAERRYCVIDVQDAQQQNGDYFKAVKAQLDNGGYEALLHLLLTRDLKDFDVRKFPRTAALQDQKERNWNLEEQWWNELLMESRGMWTREVVCDDLFKYYLSFADEQKRYQRLTQSALGKFLTKHLPKGFPLRKQKEMTRNLTDDYGHSFVSKGRVYVYMFPELEEARARWNEIWGAPSGGWPAPITRDDQQRGQETDSPF